MKTTTFVFVSVAAAASAGAGCAVVPDTCVEENTCLDAGGDSTTFVPDGQSEGAVQGDTSVGEDGSAPDTSTIDSETPSCGADANTTYCGADAGCVDTTSSTENCGGCGSACPSPANASSVSCVSSECVITCGTGYNLCNNQCPGETSDPSTDPCIVSDAFGVFVVPGGTGTGTQASPLGSIGSAMALAQSSGLNRVFVCATGAYTTALSVGSSANGVTVYGGFTSCPTTGTWTWTSATRAVVAPSAPGYALAMSGASASFYDMEFDSVAAASPGGSSIAAFLANVPSASFVRCSLTAGAGQAGVDATPIANYSGASTNGNPGTAINGGGIASVTCMNGSGAAVGGEGGGPAVSGIDGVQGTPLISPADPGSATGAGGKASDASCSAGSTGANGSDGPGGASGSGATALGSLTASGWLPSGGTSGGNGGVAQGGGGGASLDIAGGGGGGGAGGCGGTGGAPGTGGGSSIALLVYDSPSVSVTSSTLTASGAGRGGNGGTGQVGQLPGTAGLPASGAECAGGSGGFGGSGGGGGGGAGGVSAAIAWAGTAAPATTSITTSVATSAAAGGTKGSGGIAARTTAPASNAGANGTPGAGGVSQAVVNLP